MWFLADGRLQSVHLSVPRTLYIDYDDAAAGGSEGRGGSAVSSSLATLLGGGQVVSRVLPGGLKPQSVLQVGQIVVCALMS